MNKFLVFVLLAAYAAVVTSKPLLEVEDCSEHEELDDYFLCRLVKTTVFVKKATEKPHDIHIINGITLVRTTPLETARTSKSLQQLEFDIASKLPSDPTKRTTKVLTMLLDSVNSFFDSHSLSLNLSKQSIGRALNEGRAKLKKLLLPLITAVGLKLAAIMPLLLGGLGFLALKALLFGKIALLIAGFSAFEKFYGGDKNATGSVFDKYPTFAVHNGAAGHWNVDPSAYQSQNPPTGYRSLNDADAKADAHNLAYSAHVQESRVKE